MALVLQSGKTHQQREDNRGNNYHQIIYTLNVEKTKYVNFDFIDFNFNSDFPFHDLDCNEDTCICKLVKKENDFKYLGVVLDSNLNWVNAYQK